MRGIRDEEEHPFHPWLKQTASVVKPASAESVVETDGIRG
jgi:hypothetical protein